MKLEKLTPEQEAKMQEVKNFWLDYINSCKNSINREKAKIGIDWLYKSIGKESPIIIYLDSPMSCQIGVNFLKKNLNQVRDQVGAQVGAQVVAQVWAQVWDQVGAQVWDQVWAQVGAQVWDQVGAQVWDQKLSYESFASYGSISDYNWVSFFDFFTQLGIIDHKGFNQFKEILLSGIYDMIQLDGFCIVSELPKELNRNNENQLHSIDKPAISFKDGYSLHYINGRYLPSKYFESISNKTFSMEDFINESNEEYKSTCIAMMQEKYGEEYLVNFFRQNLKEIDTFVDKKEAKYLEGTTKGMNVGVYTLFKGEINNEKIAYVRCYCPSTDRMFFLGVESFHNTAKDAIASLYRIPSKLKGHIKSISRQGERFSTILTESGKEVLKSMSNEEISNNSSLTGNEYFSLIKFEF